MRLRVLAVVTTAAFLVPGSAMAANYPPPKDPGKGPKVTGKGKTLTVCKQKKCKYKTVQKAVGAATGRDTIKVKAGTYKEGVQVVGSRYDGLKLVASGKVQFDGKGLKGGSAQNAVFVNSADAVTIKGFRARHYKANCFFVSNVVDYTMTKLTAEDCGRYGVFAFNSKGGEMSNSEAFYNADSGFYVGQTKPVTGKVRRTIVKNVKAWGNVLGFSGSNMRYVTITKSQWFNNGTGIVPNAIDTEKYPPPSHNVISDNDIFWNNFNFYYGAPFKIPGISAATIPYPIGVGLLLFGGQDTTVENNRISGNWLAGFGEIPAVQLAGSDDPAKKEASVLRNDVVRNNQFGLGGADLNGHDMVYDGSGTGNCFEGNQTTSPNLPASNATFVPCPGPAANTLDPSVLPEALGWIVGTSRDNPASYEAFWQKHPHAARKGVQPLERFSK